MMRLVTTTDGGALVTPGEGLPRPYLSGSGSSHLKPYFTAARYTYHVSGIREYVYDLPMDVPRPLILFTRRLMPVSEVVFPPNGTRRDGQLLRPFFPRWTHPPVVSMLPPSPLCTEDTSDVALGDPEYLWRAHKQTAVQLAWSFDARAVFLVRVFNFTSGKIRDIKHCAKTLEVALYALTGARGFTIIPPEAALLKMGFAASFIVLDFPTTASRFILARKVFTCSEISFFAHPRAVSAAPLVLVIEGFGTASSESVVAAVRRRLESGDTLSMFVESVAGVHGIEGDVAPGIARSILTGADVTVYDADDGARLTRAVIQCPTDSVVRWRAVNRYLHALLFPCGRFIGTPRIGVRCTGCHSIEHEAARCPFPLVSGWSGPPAGADRIGEI